MSSCEYKPISYTHETFHTVYSIIKGHIVTLMNLFRKKVTLMYPEEHWELPKGYRGMPCLPISPETGKDLCIGCQACARVCPTQLITIETHRGEDKKLVVDSFTFNAQLCMLCGLCSEVCPVNAIRMSKDYEIATFTREELIFNREKLNEIGGVIEVTENDEAEGSVVTNA